MPRAFAATLSLTTAALLLAGGAAAGGDPDIAALQVGLRAKGLYAGTVDGVLGSGTQVAVRRFQRRVRLAPDGVAGPRTRAALGRYGRPSPLGRRTLTLGSRGWDVAALQFSLAWHGFPSGVFDGLLGAHTFAALQGFQTWAGIRADGAAGAATIAALRAPPPRSPSLLGRPVPGPTGDLFGPRGARFHAGVDFPAPTGTPIAAAGAGVVTFAGIGTGWGNVVVLAHGSGLRTRYAHLSRIDVHLGDRVAAGATVGLVGATGEATGPHLHFEVLVRGANVDPLTAFETSS